MGGGVGGGVIRLCALRLNNRVATGRWVRAFLGLQEYALLLPSFLDMNATLARVVGHT